MLSLQSWLKLYNITINDQKIFINSWKFGHIFPRTVKQAASAVSLLPGAIAAPAVSAAASSFPLAINGARSPPWAPKKLPEAWKGPKEDAPRRAALRARWRRSKGIQGHIRPSTARRNVKDR